MKLQPLDLGRLPYAAALDFQEKRVADRKIGAVPDTLILVEHPPVYTLGRNADSTNILPRGNDSKTDSIPVIRTSRGGQVTYHGPGQIIGYPILKLSGIGKGVIHYINKLEEVLIRTLKAFNISGRTDPANRGVWVEMHKIAALGVRITGGVTMHGFSLNVNVNLDDYKGIIPCGIRQRGVTSMHQFVPDIRMNTVKPVLIKSFRDVFGYNELIGSTTPTWKEERQNDS